MHVLRTYTLFIGPAAEESVVVRQHQLEGRCQVMLLQWAEVVVQDGQMVVHGAQELIRDAQVLEIVHHLHQQLTASIHESKSFHKPEVRKFGTLSELLCWQSGMPVIEQREIVSFASRGKP